MRAPASINTNAQCAALSILLLTLEPCGYGSAHDMTALATASQIAASSGVSFCMVSRTYEQCSAVINGCEYR